ncbi:MAG: hypothetical protein ACK5M7_08690 [Draconibacterium sp.]
MRRKEKLKKYPDLLVPIYHCPFEVIEKDCPFSEFRETELAEEHEMRINSLSSAQLDKLRKHHRACLMKKIERREAVTHG